MTEKKPVFYMPIGLPASGKSTFMKTMKDTVVLSGDELRSEMFGDESLQYTDDVLKELGYDPENMTLREKEYVGQKLIWETLQKKTVQLLKEGKNVAFDGVNNIPKYRAQIIAMVAGIALIHAIVFTTDIETCIARDLRRSRTAGEETIRRVARNMVLPVFEEGFDIIDTYDKNGELISHRTREEKMRI